LAAVQASGNRQYGGLLTSCGSFRQREGVFWAEGRDLGPSLPLNEVEVNHMCSERNTWESLAGSGSQENRNWAERCCLGFGV